MSISFWGNESSRAAPRSPFGDSSRRECLETLGTKPLPSASFIYAGVSPGTAGLYRVNLQMPAGLPDGAYPMTLNLGSFTTP